MGKDFSESYGDLSDYRVLFWNKECLACAAFDGEEDEYAQHLLIDEDFEDMFAEAKEIGKDEEPSVNQILKETEEDHLGTPFGNY